MDVWSLENHRYQIVVKASGGELSQIRDKLTGREWLWKPAPGIWNNSATQLFPVVGALVQKGVRVEGQFLPLPAHGFLRQQSFECSEQSVNHILLEARATPDTLAVWPWNWRFQLRFALHADGLSVSQHVINDGPLPFWYSVGWHPGFALPVASEPGWHVQFGERPVCGPFPTRDRTLVTDGVEQMASTFQLTQDVFSAGAVYFGDCGQQRIRVCSPKGQCVITLETAEHDWLALWGIPGIDLLCIEPLAGTTDAPDFDGQIENKRGIRQLASGHCQSFTVRLRFAVDA